MTLRPILRKCVRVTSLFAVWCLQCPFVSNDGWEQGSYVWSYMSTIPTSTYEAWNSRVAMGPRKTTAFYIFLNNDVGIWLLCQGVIRIHCAKHQNRENRKIWEYRLLWHRYKSLKPFLCQKFDFTSKRGQVKCRCKLMCLPVWSE
jgi:hypothetical protein